MSILFIAPLPPPIHGQSLASEVLLNELKRDNVVHVIDMAKKKRGGVGGGVRRLVDVVSMFASVLRHVRDADIIYLTISESFSGNAKDLAFYLLCRKKLGKMFIHLHGGAGMRRIMQSHILASLNAIWLRKLKGVIILGKSHRPIFEGVVCPDIIHVVPNFAEDYLFLSEAEVFDKYRMQGGPLRVLFLSNLIKGKGYIELLQAYKSLSGEMRSRVQIDFAGAFGSDQSRCEFLQDIIGFENISYHGIVLGDKKRKLFVAAEVFCLPTYYPYEGQPISILEAYASGCVVITTNHSGIPDIFQDRINGYEVEKRSVDSLRKMLEYLIKNRSDLGAIGKRNQAIAETQYRTAIYGARLRQLLITNVAG